MLYKGHLLDKFRVIHKSKALRWRYLQCVHCHKYFRQYSSGLITTDVPFKRRTNPRKCSEIQSNK